MGLKSSGIQFQPPKRAHAAAAAWGRARSGRPPGVVRQGWHSHQRTGSDQVLSRTGNPANLTRRARKIRARVLQWIVIARGLGIARTKTLAELANHIAETAERKPGSYPAELAQISNLAALAASDLDAVLAATKVGDVWGMECGQAHRPAVAERRHPDGAGLEQAQPGHGVHGR